MTAEPSSFQREIESIQETYAGFAAADLARTRWAPFAEDEAHVRAQQLLAFAALMRAAGRLHLEGMEILDLGCGNGRHLRHCLDMGASPASLHGVDLDPTAIAQAHQLSPALDCRLAPGDAIDFPDATFDLVTHYFAFSSMPGRALRERLAAEVRRVLKPGGLFVWWDMLHMAAGAGGAGEALAAQDLFSAGEVVADLRLRARISPTEALGIGRLRRFLGRFLDPLAPPVLFQAALIRPHA